MIYYDKHGTEIHEVDVYDFNGRHEVFSRAKLEAERAKLVTDEKAEPGCTCGGWDWGHSISCRLVQDHAESQAALNTPENQATCDAIESISRALAQPTMAEKRARRYQWWDAAFRVAVAEEPTFTVVTDSNHQALFAWLTGPLGCKLITHMEHWRDEDFFSKAQSCVFMLCNMVARVAGRAVLRGGK